MRAGGETARCTAGVRCLSLIDATAAGADLITGQASRALTMLYSLPSGSPVSTTARASSADQPSSANTGLIIDYNGPHSH